jgi:hypothetical protein
MTDYRPWGWMKTLFRTKSFWVKIIKVNTRTSQQFHRDRTELHIYPFGWNVIRPLTVHRLPRGWWIEVAWGRPMEEDIIRIQDDYGRD